MTISTVAAGTTLPTLAPSNDTGQPAARGSESVAHPTKGVEPQATHAGGAELPALQPLFATMLADATAQPRDKIAGAPEAKKKIGPKTELAPRKHAEDAGPPAANAPMITPDQRPLPAIPLTLPSFTEGGHLTAMTSADLGPVLDDPRAGGGGSLAATVGTLGDEPVAASAPGLDRMALGLEASAGIDARNGFAASSGVHRTARAIAEDQARVSAPTSESARAYAAVAKATSTNATHTIHAAATLPADLRTRKAEGAASHAPDGEDHPPTPKAAVAATSAVRGDERSDTRNDDAKGDSRNDDAEPRASDAVTGADGARDDATIPTSAASTPAAAPLHGALSLPIPNHPAPVQSGATTTRTEDVRAAFAEDAISGVERAALSGHERTDFEVRAFDGTRVAINVQLRADKVHVGFAFDGKHTAAEATVRATLGALETRLGERGISAVVSFGTLQRSPHEVGVTATSSEGAGSYAASNGHREHRNDGNAREEAPQLAEVTELLRQRQPDARTSRTPASAPNGRGGWVA